MTRSPWREHYSWPVPALLLAEAPQPAADEDTVWPTTATGATCWAAELHDHLDHSDDADCNGAVTHIASWLRVQAVGRETIRVTEPRLPRHAVSWAAAAFQLGITEVTLLRSDGATSPVTPAPARAAMIGSPGSTPIGFGRRDQVTGWIVDRAEAAARMVIRAVQR